MARRRVSRVEARFVRQQLRKFAKERYGSWNKFVIALNIPPNTAANWNHTTDPSVPEPYWLIELARETNVSITWLLLGAGPQLITAQAQTPAEQVNAAIQAELRSTEGLADDEFNGAWSRLMTGQDWGREPGAGPAEAVFQLAVDGVRARLRESGRLARHHAAVVYMSRLKELVEPAKERPEILISEADIERRQALVARAEVRLAELIDAPLDRFLEEIEAVRQRHRREHRELAEGELRRAVESPKPGPTAEDDEGGT